MALTRSKDRKVANAVTRSGAVAIANTFGLPAGRDFSCPSATSFCGKICYAGKLEKIYRGVRNILTDNFEQLLAADYRGKIELLSAMIDEFRADCVKRGARMLFRIHWDGDFFSNDYAKAWAEVIDSNTDIQFWVYTRVSSAATMLSGLDNLTVYFSADRDNIETARELKRWDSNFRIAYVDSTFDEGKAVFPTAARCPENNKALPLISEAGSACARCGLCIYGRNDVLFSTTKK